MGAFLRMYLGTGYWRPATDLRRNFLVLVLELVELPVNAALREQLLMASHFAHPALMHHDDLVGALNGRKPVRHDNRRAPLGADHARERVAHAELSLGIHARGGF